jgi:hypothetical protein
MTSSLKGGSGFSDWAREATKTVNSKAAIKATAYSRLLGRNVANVVRVVTVSSVTREAFSCSSQSIFDSKDSANSSDSEHFISESL